MSRKSVGAAVVMATIVSACGLAEIADPCGLKPLNAESRLRIGPAVAFATAASLTVMAPE